MIFEGEYLNGKRHGYGKEFESGRLIFEGEYKNDKQWNGKIIEYYLSNIIIFGERNINKRGRFQYYFKKRFEGEFKNGIINGKGKEYYVNDKIKFEGEYHNGKRWNGIGYDTKGNKVYELKEGNGFVKEYDDQGKIIFIGKYLNGEKVN